jgi:hypothetical protein
VGNGKHIKNAKKCAKKMQKMHTKIAKHKKNAKKQCKNEFS